MHTIEVNPDRLVIIYDVDSDDYLSVYRDAGERRLAGWRMISIDSHVTRFTGTAGSVFSNSGDGHATHVRYTVLYTRADPIPAV